MAARQKKINVRDPEFRLQVVQEYLRLWAEFFQFIDDDIRDRKIGPEDEKRFFQHVTALASRHLALMEAAGDDMKKAEDMVNILNEAVSLSYIKTMPDAHFSKLQVDWHELFLELNKCVGRILKDPKLIKKLRAKQQPTAQA
ncbi:MAG: hypothetical protein Kow0059_02680 [Candidatus Sumerlaeia bacterium]